MNGKQLKNSILQWAIQGKLVPQDPNDEPASVLLERIRAEKAQLVKEGKIKKDKNETIIFRGDDNSHYEKLPNGEVRCIDAEIPFEIPATWCWVRLRNYAEIIGGYAFPSTELKTDKGLRVIRISDISEEGFVNKSIVRYNAPNSLDNYKIAVDDILIAMTGGTVGKSLYVQSLSEDMLLNQRVAIIRNKWFEVKYIDCVIKSPHIKEFINSRKNSTNDNISMVDIANFLIPIPPLSEQKRIIDKYQEILPSIDKYNECQEKLDTLNATLYTNLKKSILQEAIQGRLVPQDSNDEPATKLLERIRTEKQALVKQGKLKAKDITDSIIYKGDDNKYYEKCGNAVTCIDEEIQFDIPENWCWCRIGQVAEFINGLAFKPNEWETKGLPIIRIQNLSDANKQFNYTTKVFDEKFKVHNGDLLFSWSATLDAFIWQGDDSWLNQHIFKVNPYNCIDKYFLFYSLKGLVVNLKHITHGLTMKHLTRGVFENYLFALPPLAEQKRIVAKIEQALASIMSR